MSEVSHGLSHAVDRQLPWLAGASVLASVAITAFSPIPTGLPGVALDSAPLFLVERGTAVVAALTIVVGLVARTLKRELPSGFSPTTGSITYPDKITGATSAANAAIAALQARIDRDVETLFRHQANIDELAHALDLLQTRVEKLL